MYVDHARRLGRAFLYLSIRRGSDVVAHLKVKGVEIWWGRWSAPVGPSWAGRMVPP